MTILVSSSAKDASAGPSGDPGNSGRALAQALWGWGGAQEAKGPARKLHLTKRWASYLSSKRHPAQSTACKWGDRNYRHHLYFTQARLANDSAGRSASSGSDSNADLEEFDLEFDNFNLDDGGDSDADATLEAFLQDQKEQWDDLRADEQIHSHYQPFVPQTGHKFIDPEAKKIVMEFLPLFYELLVDGNLIFLSTSLLAQNGSIAK